MTRRKRIKVVFGEKIVTGDIEYIVIEPPTTNEMYKIVVLEEVDGRDIVVDIICRTEKYVCSTVDEYFNILVSINNF